MRGQGLLEYALLILFVALIVFAALMLAAPTLNTIFNSVTPVL